MACIYTYKNKEYSRKEIENLLFKEEVNPADIKYATLNDIADLLAYSNSKLILPGNEVEYTTPDNMKFKTYQEASNHISELAKNVENVDLDNISINNIKVDKNNLPSDFKNYYVSNRAEIAFMKDGKYNDDYNNEIQKLKDKYAGKFIVVKKSDYGVYPNTTENQMFFNTKEEADNAALDKSIEQYKKEKLINGFIEKNKEYEQSKEIIEEWKKVNNIQYNPEEIYSRGQEFSSVVGAYSDFDVNLMMQNLLSHIEDNEKAGGKFAISAFTKPVDKKIGHLEGGGGKIKFKIFPQSNDILWAANTDVYSGSVWDASEKVNKDKKSELIGVSYTKYPSLNNVNAVQPNLADIVDNLAHHHNELGITLTGNNFRLEYDENIPYQTKKIIDGINKILDQKYGKLVKPEIKKGKKVLDYYLTKNRDNWRLEYTVKNFQGMSILVEFFDTEPEAKQFLSNLQGIQPTQTKENLKENIESVKDRKYVDDSDYDNKLKWYNEAQTGIIPTHYSTYTDLSGKLSEKIKVFTINVGNTLNAVGMWQQEKDYDIVKDYIIGEEQNVHGVKFWILSDEFKKEALDSFKKPVKSTKEYTDQALINTKIAALKEVAKKYPRSLIRSEVRKIEDNFYMESSFNTEDGLPFQKVPSVLAVVDALPELQCE